MVFLLQRKETGALRVGEAVAVLAKLYRLETQRGLLLFALNNRLETLFRMVYNFWKNCFLRKLWFDDFYQALRFDSAPFY